MLGNLSGWHLLIILAVVVLLFGATKLPALAKGVGQSMRIFKSEIKPQADTIHDDVLATTADGTAPPAARPADAA